MHNFGTDRVLTRENFKAYNVLTNTRSSNARRTPTMCIPTIPCAGNCCRLFSRNAETELEKTKGKNQNLIGTRSTSLSHMRIYRWWVHILQIMRVHKLSLPKNTNCRTYSYFVESGHTLDEPKALLVY